MANKVRFCILYNHCLQHNAKPHWARKFIGKTHYNLKDPLNCSSVKLLFLCPKLVGTLNNPELRLSSSLLGMIIRGKWGLFTDSLNLPLIKINAKILVGRKIRPSLSGGGKMKNRLLLFPLFKRMLAPFFLFFPNTARQRCTELGSNNSLLSNICPLNRLYLKR